MKKMNCKGAHFLQTGRGLRKSLILLATIYVFDGKGKMRGSK